jgi:hypothetical protein
MVWKALGLWQLGHLHLQTALPGYWKQDGRVPPELEPYLAEES